MGYLFLIGFGQLAVANLLNHHLIKIYLPCSFPLRSMLNIKLAEIKWHNIPFPTHNFIKFVYLSINLSHLVFKSLVYLSVCLSVSLTIWCLAYHILFAIKKNVENWTKLTVGNWFSILQSSKMGVFFSQKIFKKINLFLFFIVDDPDEIDGLWKGKLILENSIIRNTAILIWNWF